MTRVLLLIIGALAWSVPAAAQSGGRLLHIGISGGASSPLGDFADVAQVGLHLGARVGARIPGSPLGAHVDAQWHRFSRKRAVIVGGSEQPPEVVPLVLNLDWERRAGRGGPGTYLTAGGGAYLRRTSAYFTLPGDDTPRVERRSATRLGFNAGLGSTFQLGSREGFLELRVHRVGAGGDEGDEAVAFVPITLGLRF